MEPPRTSACTLYFWKIKRQAYILQPTIYKSIFVEIFLVGAGIFVHFGHSAFQWHPRSLNIGANRKRGFLLVRSSNLGHGPILHRFGDFAAFMCSRPHPYSIPILEVFPLHQIARVGRQRAHGP